MQSILLSKNDFCIFFCKSRMIGIYHKFQYTYTTNSYYITVAYWSMINSSVTYNYIILDAH